LCALIVSVYVPAVPLPGVPLRAAVPFPLSLNVTPLGSVPVSFNDGVGVPVVVTVNVPATPAANVALFALVMTGDARLFAGWNAATPASLLACCTNVITGFAGAAKCGVVIRAARRSVNRIALSRFKQILARGDFSASKNILWTNPFPKMTKMLLTCWLGRVSKEYHRNLGQPRHFWAYALPTKAA
jgi:hypothetical protein